MNKFEELFVINTIMSNLANDETKFNNLEAYVNDACNTDTDEDESLVKLARCIVDASSAILQNMNRGTQEEKMQPDFVAETIYPYVAQIERCTRKIRSLPCNKGSNIDKYITIDNVISMVCPENALWKHKLALNGILDMDMDDIVHKPTADTIFDVVELLDMVMSYVSNDDIVMDENLIHAVLLLIVFTKCLGTRCRVVDVNADAELPMGYDDVAYLVSQLLGGMNGRVMADDISLTLIHDIMTSGVIRFTWNDAKYILNRVYCDISCVKLTGDDVPALTIKEYRLVMGWMIHLLKMICLISGCPCEIGKLLPVIDDDSSWFDRCLTWCKSTVETIMKFPFDIAPTGICTYTASEDTSAEDASIKLITDYYEETAHQDVYCVLALYMIARDAYKRINEPMYDQAFGPLYLECAKLPKHIIDAVLILQTSKNYIKLKQNFQQFTDDIFNHIISGLSSPIVELYKNMTHWVAHTQDPLTEDINAYTNAISDDTLKVLVYILEDMATNYNIKYTAEVKVEIYSALSSIAMELIRKTDNRASIVVSTLTTIRYIIYMILYTTNISDPQ